MADLCTFGIVNQIKCLIIYEINIIEATKCGKKEVQGLFNVA